MAELKDLWKKGTTIPTPSDLVEGGLGIDVFTGKAYSKKADGTIFVIGSGTDVLTSMVYDSNTKILTYTDEDSIDSTVDLSALVDNINVELLSDMI